MTLLEWAMRHAGSYVTAPGGQGGQCVDLCNVYLAELRGLAARRANAASWAGLALAGARWVQNGPSNYPSPGDIVVWHAQVPSVGIGVYGHVAVALAGDGRALVTLDQGWPPGAPVGAVVHGYVGITGWHHWS